jgi:hypothetical protein
MIAKSLLQNLIQKYYLGVNDEVRWIIEDNVLNINFNTPNKEIIGKVTCRQFPLEDCKLAIFDTKKLSNLISICSGDLLLEVEKQREMLTKLKISDLNFNVNYALSDPLMISKPGKVNAPNWDVEAKLTPEDIKHLIKAKSALADVDNMLITTTKDLDGQDVIEFIFGDEQGHNNKVTYKIYGNIQKEDIKLPFNSDMLRLILQSNKESEFGTFYLSDEGLIKLEFTNELVDSEYYMVRRQETQF